MAGTDRATGTDRAIFFPLILFHWDIWKIFIIRWHIFCQNIRTVSNFPNNFINCHKNMYVGNCTPKHSFRFQKKLLIWACIFKYTSKILDFIIFIHSQIFSKYAENVYFVLIISLHIKFHSAKWVFSTFWSFSIGTRVARFFDKKWPGLLCTGPVWDTNAKTNCIFF